MKQIIELHLLNRKKHLSELQAVLEKKPKYSLNISGKLQEKSASSEIFNTIPDEFNHSNKFVLGIYECNQLIGVIDILRGFPNNETAMLGLLLPREDKQQQGLGKISFNKLLSFLINFIFALVFLLVSINSFALPSITSSYEEFSIHMELWDFSMTRLL